MSAIRNFVVLQFGGARLLTSRLARTLAPPKMQTVPLPEFCIGETRSQHENSANLYLRRSLNSSSNPATRRLRSIAHGAFPFRKSSSIAAASRLNCSCAGSGGR